MVGQLVKLHLQLTWRGLRSSTAVFVISLIMSLGMIAGALQGAFWLGELRDSSLEWRNAFTGAVFGLLTLAWPLMVAFIGGSNETVDPGRFALYPVRGRSLLPGLLVAGFLGLGGVIFLVLGAGYALAWSGAGMLVLVASIVGFALGLTLCVVSGRAVGAVIAKLFRTRRAREAAMGGVFLIIMAFAIGVQFLPTLEATGSFDIDAIVAWLGSIAGVVRWTPFGWPWAIPGAVADGQWGLVVLFFAATVALIAALLVVWLGEINRGLVSPLEVGGSGERIKGTGLFDRFFPAGPVGSIAKRSVRLWRRDPRRLMSLASTMLMPVVMSVTIFAMTRRNAFGDNDGETVSYIISFMPVLLGFMMAQSTMWDISFDGSALASQMVVGVRGVDDRRGRALAALAIFGPVQLVYLLGVFVYTGQWGILPGVLGLTATVMFGGAGLGSLVGGYWQFAQRPTGEMTVTKVNNTGGMSALIGSLIGMFGPLVLAIPSGALAVAGIWYAWATWAALVVGIGVGALVLHLGIVKGGRKLDATWPEVLERITWKG